MKLIQIIFILLGVMCYFYLGMHCIARAEDKTRLHLAQCLIAETDGYSGYNNAEWSAHAWVLKKRANRKGVSLDVMVIEYCAVFDKRASVYYSTRSTKIRKTTVENHEHGSATWWRAAFTFVDLFLQGKVKDPCPAAIHFGNADDVKDKPLVEVCKWLGRRGNKFYRVRNGD